MVAGEIEDGMVVVVGTEMTLRMMTTVRLNMTGRILIKSNGAKGGGTEQGGTRWFRPRVRTHGGKREATRGPLPLDIQREIKVTLQQETLAHHSVGAPVVVTAIGHRKKDRKDRTKAAAVMTTIRPDMRRSTKPRSRTLGNSKKRSE